MSFVDILGVERKSTRTNLMGSYFKPLRRKIGVLTLVLACVFTAGWVRSRCHEDLVLVPTGDVVRVCTSLDSRFISGVARPKRPSSHPPFPVWRALPFCTLDRFIARGSLRTHWLIGGFGVGEMEATPPFEVWIISYPPIVIPLTLISAWLLLRKPRKATQEKITEPVPVEGA